ncbi:TPA: DUF3265 domain-containing protein [Vibrio vulnificus]|nr:DUF3265 domain-containing protein [Vibrio vulnificus]QET76468.1 DUF3265 domain-containing protein [Vibrio vulnificus]HAS6140440.1 DUF3265 domain-containing protein [Vibrio vulnificus]HAU8276876.1 DUF3265 domain-containing protein [Vibrio vulnificus]HAU8281188.1 DUF3265 domain-containing protein [Vibrio vulnificus]
MSACPNTGVESCVDERRGKKQLTNCLRVIRNAWHFHHALILVFKVVCRSFGIALLTP